MQIAKLSCYEAKSVVDWVDEEEGYAFLPRAGGRGTTLKQNCCINTLSSVKINCISKIGWSEWWKVRFSLVYK